MTAPIVRSIPTDTYLGAINLSGSKTDVLTSIYVNNSSANVTYPNSTSWSLPVTLRVGPNTFVVNGKNALGNVSPNTTVTITNHLMGDINADGIINLTDLSMFSSDYGKSGTLSHTLSDMNGDNIVDLTDFSIVAARYNGQ